MNNWDIHTLSWYISHYEPEWIQEVYESYNSAAYIFILKKDLGQVVVGYETLRKYKNFESIIESVNKIAAQAIHRYNFQNKFKSIINEE